MLGLGSRSLMLLAVQAALAAAMPSGKRHDTATRISVSQLDSYSDYVQFARATYCTPTTEWQCGGACTALSTFEPTIVGGDGNDVQWYFVGYWPDQDTVVVAHEGTDPTQFLSDLTDIDIILTNLDSTLFPGVSDSVLVHQGFADEHALTAQTILTAVQSTLASSGSKSVTLVGHSLGGALALLDSLYVTLNLPSDITVTGVTFGLPRVGNPAFAALIDELVPNFTHINNELDIIPILPGEFLGFEHPHGEIHIVGSNNAFSCSGDDNDYNSQCTDQSVPNIFVGDILDHLGPYPPYPGGIYVGTEAC